MTARQRAEEVVVRAAAEHFPWDKQIELIEQAILAHAAGLQAACEDMLPLLEHVYTCEANADDGNGHRLWSLQRRLDAVRDALGIGKCGGGAA